MIPEGLQHRDTAESLLERVKQGPRLLSEFQSQILKGPSPRTFYFLASGGLLASSLQVLQTVEVTVPLRCRGSLLRSCCLSGNVLNGGEQTGPPESESRIFEDDFYWLP